MFNSRNKLIVASTLMVFALTGCASVKPGSQEAYDREQQEKEKTQTKEVKKSVEEMPEWMSEPPKDTSNMMYVATVGDSSKMQFAIDKALQDAKHQIAEKLQAYLTGRVKKFENEQGNEVMEDTTKSSLTKVADVSLAGFSVMKQKVVPNGPKYRAYVLVSYPLGEANKVLMSKLKGDTKLKTNLAASDAYKELEADSEQAKKDAASK